MITEFTGNAVDLGPLIESWVKQSNATNLNIKIDIPLFLTSLQDLIDGEDSVLFVLKTDDEPVGFIGCQLVISLLSGQVVANEQNWFVDKDCRGSESLRLKRSIEQWAKTRGAKKIMMTASVLAGDSFDRVCKFYSKDMQMFEVTYIKDL